MSIKRVIILLVFFCLCYCINAQDEVRTMTKKNVVFIYPFNLLDLLNPSIQLGYEHYFSQKYIVRTDVGIIIQRPLFGVDEIGFQGAFQTPYYYSGYKCRAELQRVLNTRGIHVLRRNYLGAEIYYTHNYGQVNNSYLANNTSYEDSFIQDKHKVGINIKFGKKFFFGNKTVDASGGIGIAYFVVNHIGRYNLNDPSLDRELGYVLQYGKYFRLNIPLNVRIGYAF